MPSRHSPCSTPPHTHTHLRTGWRRTAAPISICGNIEPDSRIGTSKLSIQPGAPSCSSSQGSVVLALAMRSARLERVLATRVRKKLPGDARQASSEIALHTRPSSSSARRS